MEGNLLVTAGEKELIRNGIEYMQNDDVDDEKYAEGFWDLAGAVADELVDDDMYEEVQERLYNLFQAIAEEAVNCEMMKRLCRLFGRVEEKAKARRNSFE